MTLLDGNTTSKAIFDELAHKAKQYASVTDRPPHLVAILVGNDPASKTYVENKVKRCKQIGFQSTVMNYEEDIDEAELLRKIAFINRDSGLDGGIVQLPLPKHINSQKIIEAFEPEKDLDGFHPVNFGRMASGIPCMKPATAAGIIELLRRYNIETEGKHCVVIGRSMIVGLPTAIMISGKEHPGYATVTMCHSKTPDVKSFTREADILIAAAGVHHMIGPDDIRDGAVVIDVGIHRIEDASKKRGFRLEGDIQFDAVKEKCLAVTPVPGGVGPMTIAALLQNTWWSYCRQMELNEELDMVGMGNAEA